MTDVMIGGLPGTGKTLCAQVIKSLGYDLGIRRELQVTSYLSKRICGQLEPGAYPYYLPYDRTKHAPLYPQLEIEPFVTPPQVIVVAYISAIVPLLRKYEPKTLIYCDRPFKNWLPPVQRAEPQRNIDFEQAYTSSLDLTCDLILHESPTNLIFWNVDKKHFSVVIRDDLPEEIQEDALNRKVQELLIKNPRLGM